VFDEKVGKIKSCCLMKLEQVVGWLNKTE